MKNHPHTPPPSSYSHSPQKIPNINVNELARRIGVDEGPGKSIFQPQASSQPPSYISHLPLEILSEIFSYCIPQERFPVVCRTQAPLLLTGVSVSWRALALASPNLWTALHINYKDPVEDIPATDLWLSRSGNRSLTLSIAVDFGEQPQQEIIDTLCKHSKRWKDVRFDFRHLCCPPMYDLDLARDNVPELRTFEFHVRDISDTNLCPITYLLSSAPNLRALTWVDDLADTDTLLQLPLGRLTRLSLTMDHGTLDYLQVLNECSNLEHIRITKPFSTTPQSRPPLSLPKLTSLNISSDLTGLLEHLTLPALREVRIHAESDQQAQAHADLTSFLSLIDRSACAITTLSATPPVTEPTLLMCLRRVSASLVKLSIEGIRLGDAFIESLTRRTTQRSVGADCFNDAGGSENDDCRDEDVLCPALEEINFDTHVACTQGALAAMVESRLVQSSLRSTEQGICSLISRIRVVDGHRDLERLEELASLSKKQMGNSQTENSLRTRAVLTVDVIRKKPFFRKKQAVSR